MTEQTFTPWNLDRAFELKDDTAPEVVETVMMTKGILMTPRHPHECVVKHQFAYSALHVLTTGQYAYEFVCKRCRKAILADTWLFWNRTH